MAVSLGNLLLVYFVSTPNLFLAGHVPKNENEGASIGFAATALAHAAIAAPLFLQPQSTAEYMLGSASLPTNIEQDHLMGLLASCLLASASSAWTLKTLADQGELDTHSSEHLQTGLIAMAVTAIGIHLKHKTDLTNNGFGTGAAAAALTWGVPAAHMLSTARGRKRITTRIANAVDFVKNLFTFHRGFKPTTAIYAALTPIFAVAGVAYVFNPAWTLSNVMGFVLKGRDSAFIWRNVGGALLTVLPSMTYVLKEKADRDEMADPTSRALNVGLLLASAGHLAVLGPIFADGTGGKYLQTAVGVWAATAAASVIGLSSSASEKSF
jgi:hypothetical protein